MRIVYANSWKILDPRTRVGQEHEERDHIVHASPTKLTPHVHHALTTMRKQAVIAEQRINGTTTKLSCGGVLKIYLPR